MGLWQSLNRPILGTQRGYVFRWSEPFLMRLRLHRDWLPRLAMCAAVCVAAGSVFFNVGAAEAKRGMGAGPIAAAVFGVIVMGFALSVAIFMGPEAFTSRVKIQEEKLTRERHTMSFLSGLRIWESWSYVQLTIFFVPPQALGQTFSILVMPPTRKRAKPSLVGVPWHVDLTAVFRYLTERGVRIVEAPEGVEAVRRQHPYSRSAILGTMVVSGAVTIWMACVAAGLPVLPKIALPQPGQRPNPAGAGPVAPLRPPNNAGGAPAAIPQPAVPPQLGRLPNVVAMPNDVTATNPVVVTNTLARTLSLPVAGLRNSIALSPDGKRLLISDFGKVRIWEPFQEDALAEHKLESPHQPTTALGFCADGTQALWGGLLSTEVWSVSTGRTIARIEHPRSPLRTATLSPDAKWLAHGASQQVVVYDVVNQREHFRGELPNLLKSLAVNADGTQVMASDGHAIAAWNLTDGRPRPTVEVQRNGLQFPLVALPATGRAVFAERSGDVVFWDLRRQAASAAVQVKGPVECVAVSADGRAAFAAVPGAIVVWDMGLGTEAGRLPCRDGREGRVVALAATPEGRYCASLSNLGSEVSLWDLWGGP